MPFCEIKQADETKAHSKKEIYQQNAWVYEEIDQVRGWLKDFDKFLVQNYPEKFTKKVVAETTTGPNIEQTTESQSLRILKVCTKRSKATKLVFCSDD